jgi:hypothetical protein
MLRIPTNSNVRLSFSHSMRKILRLSREISPNPRTIEPVGKMCAIPHSMVRMLPVIITIIDNTKTSFY